MRARSGHFGQDVNLMSSDEAAMIMDAEQESAMIPAEFEDSTLSETIQELAEPQADLDFKTQVVTTATDQALSEKVAVTVDQKKKMKRYLLWGALGVIGLRRFL